MRGDMSKGITGLTAMAVAWVRDPEDPTSFRSRFPPPGPGGSMSDIRHVWIRLPILGCYVFLIGLMPLAQAAGQAEPGEHDGNVVTEWNAIAQNAIVTVGAQPIQRSQLWMTLVHVAIYDAVTSINGQYEQFKVTPAHLRPASRDAAAIAAAHGILVSLLPTPPAFENALLPGLAQVTPFALASASQFRPGPPPALSSRLWTRDYTEVKSFGVATGSL